MSLEATGVAGALGTAKIARENAGELDSPTSRERTLGHTVCRLLVYNMKCMHRYSIQKGLITQSHRHAYMYVLYTCWGLVGGQICCKVVEELGMSNDQHYML